MSNSTPALRLENIVKTFPGVRALDGVSFEVMPGEVHALMGENGAGKSTLMKVLGGIYQPDEGTVFIDEKPVVMTSPLEAKHKGIVFVHQELSLATELTVAENIYLGELPRKRFGRVDWQALFNNTDAILQRLNVGFDARTKLGDLSIFRITHRVSVLRDGSHRGTLDTATTSEEEVTQLMIGRKLDLTRHVRDHEYGDIALEVNELSCGSLYENVSFNVCSGEVVGFYGLVGAGRTEIAETLFGLRTPDSGTIRLDGQDASIKSPIDAISLGISLVPEDRKEQGLVLGMNCRDNMTLPQVNELKAGPFVSDNDSMVIFDKYRDKLDIKTPSWRQLAGNLSGGNQQKIVIGKWLSMNPKVLIVDEPTRGIDVGSKSEIHKLIRDLASQGYTVIVISSEMPEVLHVSDRIIAMYNGKIMREFTSEEVTEDSLIHAISGLGDNDSRHA